MSKSSRLLKQLHMEKLITSLNSFILLGFLHEGQESWFFLLYIVYHVGEEYLKMYITLANTSIFLNLIDVPFLNSTSVAKIITAQQFFVPSWSLSRSRSKDFYDQYGIFSQCLHPKLTLMLRHRCVNVCERFRNSQIEMIPHFRPSMNVCELVNVPNVVKHTLRSLEDLKSAIQMSIYHQCFFIMQENQSL